jgi:hypothetical protein
VELALALEADAENPDVGDLLLLNGQVIFTSVLADEVAQRLLVRFNFWRGEWFLNLLAGTPYIEAILGKGIPDRVVRSVFTAVVVGCAGVAALDSMTIAREHPRRLVVEFTARLEDGSTFRSTEYGPFVVTYARIA